MSLKSKSFSAVRWTSFAALFRSGLQFLQLVILARLLVPEDFGLMAIVGSIVAILRLFSDLGLGKAIIHHSEITPGQLSSLYWLNLMAALLLMVAMAVAAPLTGHLYGEPRLMPILCIAGTVFPLGAIGHQFRMLAEKELRFSTLAGMEIYSGLIGFAAAIAVALTGGGVWAIVTGMLVGAACSSILSWWLLSADWRPAWHLRIAECRQFLHFGGYTMGESLANIVRMQSDVFIAGLLFGPAALGLYSLPRDLCLRIAFIINPIITRVGFPVMAKAQHDTDRLKFIYLQTLRMTASVNFPIFLALLVFAEEVVVLLFGERWHGSAGYLQIFAAFGLIRSIGNPVGSLVYAAGQARLAFWWNLSLLAIFPPIFYAGASLGGIEGLVWTMLVIQVGVYVFAWAILVHPLCGAGFVEYVGQIIPPLAIALAASGCAYVIDMTIGIKLVSLVVSLSVGMALYVGLSCRFNRRWVDAMLELLRIR